MIRFSCCLLRLIPTLLVLMLLTSPVARAAIVVVGTNSINQSSPVTTVSLNLPAGTQAGDLLLVSLVWRGDGTAPLPAGWQLVAGTPINQGNTLSLQQMWRIATSNETSPVTFALPGSVNARAAAAITALRGVDTSNPLINSMSASAANGNRPTSPSLSLATAPAQLVMVAAQANGNHSLTAPSGMAVLQNSTNTSAGPNGISFLSATEAVASTGATGNRVTNSTGTNSWVASLLALRPALALNCFNDDFNRSDLGDDWRVTNKRGAFGNPRIVDGRLRMTTTLGNSSTAATFQRLFPAAGNLIVLEFDFLAYQANAGATGGDGMAVVLSDASVTPEPGGFGGSLGYAQRSGESGFAGGWLGLGLDSYGNYSSGSEGRNGGPGLRRDAVALRGSGSGSTGYAYLAGTNTLSPTVRNPTGHRYRITIDSQQASQVWVRIERDHGSGFVNLIGPINVRTSPGQAPTPERLLLTLTGSTGASFDNNEIDNLRICAYRSEPISTQIDHFRILHDGSGLTCLPESVTVQACRNSTCSEPFTDPVSLTLNPDSTWTGGRNQILTGGTGTFELRRSVAGDVVLGLANTTPTAANVTRCFRSGLEGSCVITFRQAGLVFDVPNGLAGRPDTINLRALQTQGGSTVCAPALTGARNIQFKAQYLNPTTGSKPIMVNNVPVPDGSWSTIGLNFGALASVPLTVSYADAGSVRLEARYLGNAADGTDGITLIGSDDFIRHPAGFCIQVAGGACTAGAACPVRAQAGASLATTISARAWESDVDTDLCVGNAITPNYRQPDLELRPDLVAPVGGTAGEISPPRISFEASDQGSKTLNIAFSEVGVLRAVVDPPDLAYLGSITVPASASAPVGRITPARLLATASTPVPESACTAGSFTYLGQPFGFSVPPRLTVTALNVNGGVTRNYDHPDFWKLGSPSLSGRRWVDASGSGRTLEALIPAGSTLWSVGVAGDGVRSAEIQNERLRYVKDHLAEPFDLRMHWRIPATELTDSDGICHQALGTGCTDFELRDITGPSIRSGRLVIDSAHSALEDRAISLTVRAEILQGGRQVTHIADSCTRLDQISSLRLDSGSESDQRDGTVLVGGATVNLGGLGTLLAGQRNLTLSAPGLGHGGFVDVQALLGGSGSNAQSWLQHDWRGTGRFDENPVGRASWGLYRGNARVIRQREILR